MTESTTPKPDAVEREPPKILGRSMTPIGPNSWVLELSNKLSARLEWRFAGLYAGIEFGRVVAWGKSIPESIAAIERELLAIRDAIPARTEEQAAKPSNFEAAYRARLDWFPPTESAKTAEAKPHESDELSSKQRTLEELASYQVLPMAFLDGVKRAYALLGGLTDEQRGMVLRWFCRGCYRYVGPGDRCHCEQPPESGGLGGPSGSPEDLRAAGWSVAAHNDYRLSGKRFTFWLMTKGVRCLKGEGSTDAEALDQIRAETGK